MQSWREDGISEIYSRGMLKYPHSVAEFILGRLRNANPNKKDKKFDLILDAGCGVGGSLKHFLPYFHSAVGFDVSEKQIEKARKLNISENVSFFIASEEKFPAENKSVDLIICASSAHYMNIKNFVSESKRVLKDGGLVVLYAHGFSNLTVERIEKSGDFTSVPGYKIMMNDFIQPTHQHLLDNGHPAGDWIKRYNGIYSQIQGMEKDRYDSMTLDYPLTLEELKDYFLSSPAYKNFHDTFRKENAPMNVMGDRLKALANSNECEDKDLKVCLTLSLFFVFFF
uniref:2-methyl-6-phytyl-1,4-hydroquinone methyltransferase-like n=1 Tax=Styela clava TaxID=7725 RepID=UPI001939B167|nr:2-methyl-6-phytyl-1,4-hydroquinone methyltransferase-like [Styela clava]